MTSVSGLAKIVRFNWPWYFAAAGVAAAVGLAIRRQWIDGTLAQVAALGVGLTLFWAVASLAVSHYVYDRSAVARGAWLDGSDAAGVRRAARFHGGLDEAAGAVGARLPAIDVTTFDIYDAARVGSPSLRRARSVAGASAPTVAPDRVPLPDGVLDLALVVFSAHEIRDAALRAAFFGELRRVLAQRGRALVVEHLRDPWNFIAYGPGAFHFLSRATWLRAFADGGLVLLTERACTPFVRVFTLGRPA